MQLDHASRELLLRIGCFSIGSYDPWKFKNWDQGASDACARFVAPLLATASHARLYPSSSFRKNGANNRSFLISRKGHLEIDLRQECVLGAEEFWSAGAAGGEYQRGTIVVVQPKEVLLAPQLKDCVLYGVPASRHQILKGSSAAAVRYAESHERTAERLFVFSASNGVADVEVYPPKGQEIEEYTVASMSANAPGWKLS